MNDSEEEEGYRGPAEVVVGALPAVTVQVQLAGNFEPISGRYVWHGRVRTLTDALGEDADLSPGTELRITGPQGTATARITGVDLWGSHLVDGVTPPPFSRV
ncbi:MULTISPECIES: DUF4873 domain-containing protein [Rhodococcus]|jgi:hypothetical protein|uniref:DUF4873 domain-containing protein n=1 Tax=Rhodococcus oxybenzonivorans TaxID=1990687 RepID=A0AAE4V2V2_9NOCA|nr:MULTISPECIES: DUF4873 domain-containing protein [Rhodococcus]MDV7240513.1 DUF4873 domain-containing protein [Rhodococcus oxybenzonivorans]MDV7266804.1 DUF4873 domain-containing protein [Rhodococcus oxybenzonivorans]MDV7272786.1 DUF4873 domain-containing protein [Rhodococcus oxybenzonivorans]MDV7333475.1 DUF4873 domain-containing protein [Rhodococcus oxybenzonivorans]MDV7342642.1 DUF4873 domain-containing protein [Rhodococcus oxybenzonivorans]